MVLTACLSQTLRNLFGMLLSEDSLANTSYFYLFFTLPAACIIVVLYTIVLDCQNKTPMLLDMRKTFAFFNVNPHELKYCVDCEQMRLKASVHCSHCYACITN